MADAGAGRDVVDAVLIDNGRPLGVLSVPEEELPRIGQAIRAAGVEVRAATEVRNGVYAYGAPCEIEHPRPCELGITLAAVQGLVADAGGTTPEIDAIERAGEFTEAQAEEAVRHTIAQMPDGSARSEAEAWRDMAFGGGAKHV